MRKGSSRSLACVLTASLASIAVSAFAYPRMIHPAHYSSPSGSYDLVVDPDDAEGTGGASYRLSHNGHVLWSEHRPFTLVEVGVTDTGIVAGHADSRTSHNVIIGRSGSLVLDKETKFVPITVGTAAPVVRTICASQNLDRLIVPEYAIQDEKTYKFAEVWRQYQLSTGKILPDFDPTSMESQLPKDAVPDIAIAVAGTPLILMHWSADTGNFLTLLDASYNILWRHSFPNEFGTSIPGKYYLYGRKLRAYSNPLWSPSNGRFFFRPTMAGVTISYAVFQDKTGHWRVHTIGSEPFKITDTKVPRVKNVRLRPLGQFGLHLPGASPPNPIHAIDSFTVAQAGHIAFLRDMHSRHPGLVVVDQTGKVKHVTPIPVNISGRTLPWVRRQVVWLGGSRYAVAITFRPALLIVDTATNAVKPLPNLDLQNIDSIAALPGGAFAVLDRSQRIIEAYSKNAKRIWREQLSKGEVDTGSKAGLVSAANDRIALVDFQNQKIRYRSCLTGKYLGYRTLKDNTSLKDSVLVPLGQDTAGGFTALDDGDNPSIYRYLANGTLIQTMPFPRSINGGAIRVNSSGAQRASDGKIWISDRNRLIELDEHAHLSRVLGMSSAWFSADYMSTPIITPQNLIVKAGSETQTLHIFDTHGRYLHDCKLDKADFGSPQRVDGIHVSTEGDVFVENDANWPEKVVQFGPDGRRLGSVTLRQDHIAPSASTMRHAVGWTTGWTGLDFIDGHGRIAYSISRGLDDRWLDGVSDLSLAPGGSLAVLNCSKSDYVRRVTLYSATGKRMGGFPIPTSLDAPTYANSIAYNGRIVLLALEGSVYGISPQGRFLWRFTPRPTGGDFRIVFTDNGRTLTMWTDDLHFEKYALPGSSIKR